MLFNNLPAYSGPYKVSCRDIEYNLNITRNIDQDGSVLLRICYPSESNKLYNQLMNWAPYPSNMYMRSFLDYLKIPTTISDPLVNYLYGHPKQGSYVSDGSDLLKRIDQFPVAFFSHGLAGARTLYSGTCGELASHGIVVAAIEHQDGSAAYSYRSSKPQELRYKTPDGKEGSPENLLFRQKQIILRKKELKDALKVLELLNQGQLKKEGLYIPDEKDSEWQYLKELNKNKDEREFWFDGLSGFKNRLNFKETYLLGHSFGGSTVLEILKEKDNPYKLGIVFDPWMYPVTNGTITKPNLGILTDAFSKWQPNYNETLKLLQTNDDNQVFVLLNSMHYHQSDVPALVENALPFLRNVMPLMEHVLPLLQSELRLVQKLFPFSKLLSISAKQALKDNVNAALKFIELHMDPNLKQNLKLNIIDNLNDNTRFISINKKI
ncbi:hypothetical protein K502DRAFT_360497 [Neoconidiobolus thromboides FSU 785]|nr:hypothetical protein K502DRAFT_360497 [Neoconidiobolus thromboides FSU 785]